MNIAILGYGKEGKSVENYFKKDNEITIFDNFKNDEIKNFNLKKFDLVFRSPSIPPLDANWTSVTKYFFDNCICPIIGVTGTKGKGTTCSLITSILESLGKKVYLVGNIGNPAIDILDQIQPDDVVVYELSSFQLWDLNVSPHISVVLSIEPDHLNVHKDFTEYVSAKSNIAKYQNSNDFCIYNSKNPDSTSIANASLAQKISYPIINGRPKNLDKLLDNLYIPGQHNRENAEAALCAVNALYDEPLEAFIKNHHAQLSSGLANFHGLPHRLEFLRELNHVKYYDDNFSTNIASTKVAIDAFPNSHLIVIAGGRDKTSYADLPDLANLLTTSQNISKVILIGESGQELYSKFSNQKFILAKNLRNAVMQAKNEAEQLADAIVVMSPAAASFDMFDNVYDRGDKFKKIINELS